MRTMPGFEHPASTVERLQQDRVFVPTIFVLLGAMICLRMPDIIATGRFWCEEGNVFFHNAWVLPAGKALFNPFGGYLNLAANAATLAGRWLLPVPPPPMPRSRSRLWSSSARSPCS